VSPLLPLLPSSLTSSPLLLFSSCNSNNIIAGLFTLPLKADAYKQIYGNNILVLHMLFSAMVRNACFLLVAACLCTVDAFTSTTTSCLYGKISSFDRLVCCSSSVLDENEEYACIINRRELFTKTLSAPLFIATRASAANLPPSTGADLSKTGSIDTLVPIVAMKQGLDSVKSQLVSKSADAIILPEECQSILKTLLQSGMPRNENDFKKLFDAYSTKVSYKQKFLDQNAFLVCE
jgi:hypothetical protein